MGPDTTSLLSLCFSSRHPFQNQQKMKHRLYESISQDIPQISQQTNKQAEPKQKAETDRESHLLTILHEIDTSSSKTKKAYVINKEFCSLKQRSTAQRRPRVFSVGRRRNRPKSTTRWVDDSTIWIGLYDSITRRYIYASVYEIGFFTFSHLRNCHSLQTRFSLM